MLTVIYYWYVLTEKWSVLSEKWRLVKLVILFSGGATVSLDMTSFFVFWTERSLGL